MSLSPGARWELKGTSVDIVIIWPQIIKLDLARSWACVIGSHIEMQSPSYK